MAESLSANTSFMGCSQGAGLQKKKDVYHCQFRWQGRKYTIKVGAVTQQAAQANAGAVDHLLHKLAQGYVTLPEGIDIRTFVLQDGQSPQQVVERLADKRQNVTVKLLRDTYLKADRYTLEAYTGKAMVSDIDFDTRCVMIREHKRIQGVNIAPAECH